MLTRKNGATFAGPVKINGISKFTKKTVVGYNCHFNGIKIGGKGRVVIGDNFHSGAKVVFITSFHNYNGKSLPYDETTIDGDIVIEDNVWIGYGVIVLGGVRIGEGAIIQAGSVVVSDVPPLSICGGAPARVFKSRDEEKYNELKTNKAFF